MKIVRLECYNTNILKYSFIHNTASWIEEPLAAAWLDGVTAGFGRGLTEHAWPAVMARGLGRRRHGTLPLLLRSLWRCRIARR